MTRREFMNHALLAGGAAGLSSVGKAAPELPRARGGLKVYDSRLASSRAWAGDASHTAIDVAREHQTRWVTLRKLPGRQRVCGLTTWGDYVQARGVLQDQGRRLRVESRSATLIYWEMA